MGWLFFPPLGPQQNKYPCNQCTHTYVKLTLIVSCDLMYEKRNQKPSSSQWMTHRHISKIRIQTSFIVAFLRCCCPKLSYIMNVFPHPKFYAIPYGTVTALRKMSVGAS